MNSQISLAERDLTITEIEEQIKYRQKLLLEKKQKLQQRKKENRFLEGVVNDYQKYYDYIINEKKQQMQSMVILNTYLENLMKTDKFAKHEINDAKKEQKNILKELDKIKGDLDSLIS
jgi:hypothetical protein